MAKGAEQIKVIEYGNPTLEYDRIPEYERRSMMLMFYEAMKRDIPQNAKKGAKK